MKSFEKLSYYSLFIQLFFIFTWLSELTATDSYYNVYILCAVIGSFCTINRVSESRNLSKVNAIALAAFSVVFSLMVMFSNYSVWGLFTGYSDALLFLRRFLVFFGGVVVAYNILSYLFLHLPFSVCSRGDKNIIVIFLFSLLSFSLIYLLFLWNIEYPGVLTRDSVSTMYQIFTGNYNNTMPYWHTKFVELFYRIGFYLFGEVNAAIAFYSIIQILLLSACYSYVLITLYQAGVPKWYACIVYVLFALVPYNIVFSVTLWKDILFGVSACLIITSLFRIFRGLSAQLFYDYFVFSASSFGFCLMRTNGWVAFLVTFCLMICLKHRIQRKLLRLMALVLIITWVLLNPVLSMLNVSSTDWTEACAVPFQQVARVVAGDCWLEESEREFLEEVFDLEAVKENYTPHTVDPVKFGPLKRDNIDFLEENIGEFVDVWLSIGRRYPNEYMIAWIELTRGYWNGGYNGLDKYNLYAYGVAENEFGIVHSEKDNIISDIYRNYFTFVEWNGYTTIFYSVGLHVWGLLLCMIINAMKKKEEIFLTIPCFVLILGLWIGTPVYAEFRYAYPLMISMPVILAATFFECHSLKNES